MIWKRKFNLAALNQINPNTMVDHIGIAFTAFGEDFLEATMPVDHRTIQPYGILHGGASVVLAETLGSVASVLCLDEDSTMVPVGLEINANHLKSVPKGKTVRGRCTPIRIGRMVHVWNIEIFNEKDEMTCISRLTVSIVAGKE